MMGWFRKIQRYHDLRILWPVCKEEAHGHMDIAKAVFAFHCSNDTAWTKDYTEDKLMKFIEDLK